MKVFSDTHVPSSPDDEPARRIDRSIPVDHVVGADGAAPRDRHTHPRSAPDRAREAHSVASGSTPPRDSSNNVHGQAGGPGWTKFRRASRYFDTATREQRQEILANERREREATVTTVVPSAPYVVPHGVLEPRYPYVVQYLSPSTKWTLTSNQPLETSLSCDGVDVPVAAPEIDVPASSTTCTFTLHSTSESLVTWTLTPHS